ncbi:glycosyltransferase [Kineococcus sp. SYSU DK004]|uniref:glycosyltransferase n=1 Tax=Kineococcus sp. SYSU DK004 TaxID=3383125 RepID=UPI003D7DD4A3
MTVARSALAVALATSTAVGHLVYPVALHLAARAKRPPQVEAPQEWPGVTVLVPAYLEQGVIAAKVDNVRKNGYQGELEVLVVADGDPATADAARTAGARVLLLAERGGKSQALNAGVRAATHDLVVISDANSELEYDAIAYLVSALLAPGTGAVAGEKLEGEGGELAYWRFESWIKRNEARLGTTLGLDGGLCAVRREAWEPIPTDISNDDFWVALDVMDRGWSVAYEPRALMTEPSIGSIDLSWERKTRVLGGGLWVMWRKRHLLSPARGLVSAELWGHKLWRSTLGPLSHVALLGLAAGSARRSRTAQVFLAGHAVAAAALVAQEKGRRVPLPGRVAAQVLYLQVVAVGGMRRFLRGDRVLKWDKPAR